jgi:hypothetical protein
LNVSFSQLHLLAMIGTCQLLSVHSFAQSQ